MNKSKERLQLQLAFVITVISILIIGSLLSFFPDELDVDYINEKFIQPNSQFVAEKSELLQYIILTVSFPILFIIYFFLMKNIKYKENTNIEKISRIINVVILFTIIFIILAIIIKQRLFYMEHSLYKYNVVLLVILYILFLIALKIYKGKNIKLINGLVYAFIAIIIGFISYLYINPTYEQSNFMIIHVDAYYYPIFKIISGLIPGVDFNSIYGYYSYFYSMIMNIFGNGDNIYLFSCIIAVTVFIMLSNITLFLNKFVKNKILLTIGIFSIIYFLIIQKFLISNSVYLQYVPHRVIGISILLAYMVFYLKNRESRYINLYKIIGFIISTFSIMWNLESGIIVLGVWCLFLGYETLYFNLPNEKKAWKDILKIIVMAICSVVLYLLILNLITYLKTNSFLDIKNIIFGQSVFLKAGFFMIKMPLIHPWLLIVILYAIGLVISMKNLKIIDKNNSTKNFEKSIAIFILSIIGMGIFNYYQGRSHEEVFGFIVYPAIMLGTIFLDMLIDKKQEKSINTNKICNIIIFAIISVVLVNFAGTTLYSLLGREEVKQFINKGELKNESVLKTELEEIDKILEDVEEIDIVLGGESYYYRHINKADTKKMPAYIDIFTYEDCYKIIDCIKEERTIYTDIIMLYSITNKYKNELIQTIEEKKYDVLCKKEKILILPIKLAEKVKKSLEYESILEDIKENEKILDKDTIRLYYAAQTNREKLIELIEKDYEIQYDMHNYGIELMCETISEELDITELDERLKSRREIYV